MPTTMRDNQNKETSSKASRLGSNERRKDTNITRGTEGEAGTRDWQSNNTHVIDSKGTYV